MGFLCIYYPACYSVQFSRSVISDSLQPHESQHARPPCPSPTPGVHWDSRWGLSSGCYSSCGISLAGMMPKLKLQYFGHLMQRVDSLEKTLMLGGIGARRKRGQHDEMAGWHDRLNERKFEWTPGVGDGQGVLACCDSWGQKESDTTEQLNWTELNDYITTMYLAGGHISP